LASCQQAVPHPKLKTKHLHLEIWREYVAIYAAHCQKIQTDDDTKKHADGWHGGAPS